MIIYLVGFAASTALIALGEKKKAKHFILLSALALLIPCLISALRASNIGTDTTVYLKPLTHSAIQADNIVDFFRSYWYYSWRNVYVKDYEIGFSLLVYLSAKSTNSMVAVQFVVSAFIVIPIYATLTRNRKTIPVWLGMLVFYLFFFNSTLNMMRQWIAMSFLLLAFQFLIEKKWGLTFLLSLCAMTFHLSSVIALLVYVFFWLLHLVRNKEFAMGNFRISGKMLVVCLISAVCFLALLNLDLVIKLMEMVGFTRFSNYLAGDQMRILPGQILFRLPLILFFALNWKDFRRFTPHSAFYMGMLLMDVVVSQLISVDVYSFRIGYYFTIYLLLGIPMLYSSIHSPVKRSIYTTLLVSYLVFYWYYNHVLFLRHQTYPYSFLF